MLLNVVKKLLKQKPYIWNDIDKCVFCFSSYFDNDSHGKDCIWEQLKKEVIKEEKRLQKSKNV